jgi:hypothetical protein
VPSLCIRTVTAIVERMLWYDFLTHKSYGYSEKCMRACVCLCYGKKGEGLAKTVMGSSDVIGTAQFPEYKMLLLQNLSQVFVHSDWNYWSLLSSENNFNLLPVFVFQSVSAVCHFPDIQSAVATTVQVLQCGIPMARIGRSCSVVSP